MKKSLRKEYFHLELNHEYGTDAIGAEAAEIELKDGVVTFRVKLKPASGDQASDANRCKEQGFKNIEYFSFIDKHIRKGISSFLNAHKAQIERWCIEVDYGEKFHFLCEIQPMNSGGIIFHVVGA